VGEGGLVCVLCLLVSCCSLGGGRVAGLGEGDRDVGRRVEEGSAGVADGDADELDASPISSEGAKEGVEFLGLLGVLFVEAEVSEKADLEKDE